MRDLTIYFVNPFSDPKIPPGNKKKFGEDTIRRIGTQNNGNVFDQLLNDTVDVHTTLFGGITSVSTNQAIQEARTKSVDNLIILFKNRNSRLNNFFIGNGTDKQPVYQEFFPQGVRPFTDGVNKGNVEQRMAQIKDVIDENTEVAGGTTVLAEYETFLENYNTARGSQLSKISEVSSGRTDRNIAEDAWNDQMFENLLSFANLSRGKPQNIILYMNQSILRAPKSAATDGKGRITGICTTNGAPEPGIKVHVADGNIDDTTTDGSGGYITQSLPIGQWQVQFSRNGDILKTTTVNVIDDGDTQQDVAFGS